MSDSKNILIVDDEENIRWLFTEALAESPYTVHTASSAEEALGKLKTHPYLMAEPYFNIPGYHPKLQHLSSAKGRTGIVRAS